MLISVTISGKIRSDLGYGIRSRYPLWVDFSAQMASQSGTAIFQVTLPETLSSKCLDLVSLCSYSFHGKGLIGKGKEFWLCYSELIFR